MASPLVSEPSCRNPRVGTLVSEPSCPNPRTGPATTPNRFQRTALSVNRFDRKCRSLEPPGGRSMGGEVLLGPGPGAQQPREPDPGDPRPGSLGCWTVPRASFPTGPICHSCCPARFVAAIGSRTRYNEGTAERILRSAARIPSENVAGREVCAIRNDQRSSIPGRCPALHRSSGVVGRQTKAPGPRARKH